ncbi:30443_t:CDS:2, partial [Racocetra persica]
MSVIRPVIPANKEVLEWCSDFSKLETYVSVFNLLQQINYTVINFIKLKFDKVPLDRRQEVGGQKLKSLLSETEFPGPILLSSNNPITFSLSTHQFQSHIEQNVPVNVQPAVFHVLIPLGNHPYERDPRHDPVVLFHRWIIRSKYNNVNFGFEFDPYEKSIIMLENLYERLGKDIAAFITGSALQDSISPSDSIHKIFRCQLAFELGEYYFSRNREKAFSYLCKCRLEGHSYDRTKEYKTF